MKGVSKIVWVELALTTLAITLLLSVVLVKTAQDGERKSDIGCRVVRLMYSFDSPAELVEGQVTLQELLTPSEFERLCIDDRLRAVNAYYKFGYSASRVEIVDFADGWVMYRLVNDNIDHYQLWLFMYDLNEDGLLCNIKEYKLLSMRSGGGSW